MGFKISWLAFEGMTKPSMLELLDFRDLGTEDEANEAPFSAAQLASGWSVIWSNDFGWVETQALQWLGAHGRTLTCQVHEGIMFSAVHGTEENVERWSVQHDSERGLRDLQIAGTPPDALDGIKAKLLAEQDGSEDVDYVFDIPVELAFQLTGFRHDLWDYPQGKQPHFTMVERKT